jgi:2-aminoethylphosphonate-pyruvate transaminase
MEAAVTSIVPPGGRLLVVTNGVYGQRVADMAAVHEIDVLPVKLPWDRPIDVRAVADALGKSEVAGVAMMHHETTTGVENPVAAVGKLAEEHGATFIVDAISSFGGVPFRLSEWRADFMLGSSNKCLQSVSGVPFIIGRRTAFEPFPPRTVSLDLYRQYRSFEDTGQSLFTPTIPAVYALRQALRELAAEGGIEARYERYTRNWRRLRQGLAELGFELLLPEDYEAHLLVTVKEPAGFNYQVFYEALRQRGLILYAPNLAGLAGGNTFRIAIIGDLDLPDVERLLKAMAETYAAQPA